MLKQRSRNILDAVIREFIKTGGPVSSSYLYGRYNFGIKPAMIRFEMNNLERLGFLERSHHSSGRIPTDKGYKVFVKKILMSSGSRGGDIPSKRLIEYFKKFLLKDFLENFSYMVDIFGIAADVRKKKVYRCGLANLIYRLECDTMEDIKDDIRMIVKDFESFEDMDYFIGKAMPVFDGKNFIKFFIGGRNPITRSRSLSVIGANYSLRGKDIILFAVGPKRMDYERAVNIFVGLKKLSNNNYGG